VVLTVAENERSQFFENETLNSDIRFFKEASILIGTRLYPVYSEMLYMGTGLALAFVCIMWLYTGLAQCIV